MYGVALKLRIMDLNVVQELETDQYDVVSAMSSLVQMCLESKNMVLLKSLYCVVLLERVKCSGVEFFKHHIGPTIIGRSQSNAKMWVDKELSCSQVLPPNAIEHEGFS